jgi:hypothetical protein
MPDKAHDRNRGFTNDDVKDVIVGELNAHRTPLPTDVQGEPLYMVLLEQGCYKAGNPDGELGEHYKFSYGGRDHLCAWVYQGDDIPGTMPTIGHEFVEAVTYETAGTEIGDPCHGLTQVLEGVKVEAYLSKRLNKCIIPGALAPTPPPP